MLFSLFVIAFTSATLLPGTSEAALSGVIAADLAPVWLAVMVATSGNTLGSCVNWLMGRFFSHFRHRKWFPLKVDQFERYENWYHKWGVWSLLLSWMPVIGDPLTVIAGVARTSIFVFLPVVLLAKAGRYLVIAGIFQIIL